MGIRARHSNYALFDRIWGKCFILSSLLLFGILIATNQNWDSQDSTWKLCSIYLYLYLFLKLQRGGLQPIRTTSQCKCISLIWCFFSVYFKVGEIEQHSTHSIFNFRHSLGAMCTAAIYNYCKLLFGTWHTNCNCSCGNTASEHQMRIIKYFKPWISVSWMAFRITVAMHADLLFENFNKMIRRKIEIIMSGKWAIFLI